MNKILFLLVSVSLLLLLTIVSGALLIENTKIDPNNIYFNDKSGKSRVIIWGDSIRNLEIKDSDALLYDYSIINGYCLLIDNNKLKQVKETAEKYNIDYMIDSPDLKLDFDKSDEKTEANKIYGEYGDVKYNDLGSKIAILDTGSAYPSLAERDFVEDDYYADDENGHGTAIVSIIKRTDPRANIYVAKIADKNGNAYISDVIAAIDWAVEKDVDIITLSMCSQLKDNTTSPITLAVDNAVDKGIVCVIPAGNSADDVKNFQPSNSDEAIVVMSCNSDFIPSSFSNKGGDIYAVGEDILARSIEDSKIGENIEDNIVKVSGTSFSSAKVAGVIGLLKEENPSLTPEEIKEVLIYNNRINEDIVGRVNIENA